MKRRMLENLLKNAAVKLVLVLMFSSITAVGASAATVRGRVDRRDMYGRSYPASYVRVTLYSQRFGRSSPAVTGPDGMYYFYNIAPGGYYLEVWVDPDKPPRSFTINVPERPYVDIPPILIP